MKRLIAKIRRWFKRPPLRFEIIQTINPDKYYLSCIAANGEILMTSGSSTHDSIKDKLRAIEKFVTMYNGDMSNIHPEKQIHMNVKIAANYKPFVSMEVCEYGSNYPEEVDYYKLMHSECYESITNANSLVELFYDYAEYYI